MQQATIIYVTVCVGILASCWCTLSQYLYKSVEYTDGAGKGRRPADTKPGDETLRSRHILGALLLVRSSALALNSRCYDWENAGDVNICIIYTYIYRSIYREKEREFDR